MNGSSRNTSSTRHVIYSISAKVCLEKKKHYKTMANVQNYSPSTGL